MNTSKTPSLASPFSHIYYEEEALSYPLAKKLLADRPQSVKISIGHYKDIFNRANQDFIAQKNAPSLLLAVNHGELIYPGARVCQSFGYEHFYYCSNLYNCIYDCEYCYLQGMYPSGHLVVFVNTADYFARIEAILREHPMYLCISYDTDLLALENMLGLVAAWTDFVLAHENLTIEIRTKSCIDPGSLHLPICERVIYAWTLSPQEVCSAYEHKAPATDLRIKAAARAASQGYPLRLCFDPMLAIPQYQMAYSRLFDQVFASIPGDVPVDASIGVFRISASYLKSMRKKRSCAITTYPYENIEGVATYDAKRSREMLDFARSCLNQYMSPDRIYETDF